MYYAVQPAEIDTLEKLTDLIAVILEDSVWTILPATPDFQAMETLLPSEFRFLISLPSIRKAIKAVYQLPYPDRQWVYKAFQNDIAFPQHIDDGGYSLSDLPACSGDGYAALKNLCTRLYKIVAGSSKPSSSKSGKALFSSALLRRKFLKLNGAFGRVCPVCAREIYFSEWEGDVDHYFPKAAHPTLMFHPYNLLPACADCNGLKNKSAKEPVDRKDAGAGELRTVFLPYLRSASREVKLSVVESRDVERDLKIAINPGPGGDRWTRKRIKNMDRLYNLTGRWSGVLEGVYGDIEAEVQQKRTEGVTPEEWPAVLREILSAAAKSTASRTDFIKGVYCSWLLERSDGELVEIFPYRTLSLPPEEA